MRARSALKPDVPSFGYATFLSINATSIWGGIYPYLPAFCQTSLTTIVFYTVQIAVFWLASARPWPSVGASGPSAGRTCWRSRRRSGSGRSAGRGHVPGPRAALVLAGGAHRRGVGGLPHELAARVRLARQRARQPRLIKGTVQRAGDLFRASVPTALTHLYTPGAGAAGGAVPVDRRARDGAQHRLDDVPREHAVSRTRCAGASCRRCRWHAGFCAAANGSSWPRTRSCAPGTSAAAALRLVTVFTGWRWRPSRWTSWRVRGV